jgi:rusticyanin
VAAVVAVVIAVALVIGAYWLGYGRGARAGWTGMGMTPDPTSSANQALADRIGQSAGKTWAGRAPQAVTAARAQMLGDQAPAGATVNPASNEVTFAAASVSLAIEASPPNGTDMAFRIAGLTNPTLIVPQGAQVSVQFINADPDQAHAWEITSGSPPFGFTPAGRIPAIPGAAAAVIGDPTTAGDGARTITFQATPTGSYQYICPMPGHAQMGMHGQFIVH